MRWSNFSRACSLAACVLLLAACGSRQGGDGSGRGSDGDGREGGFLERIFGDDSVREGGNEAPPRVETPAEIPRFQSRVSLPVTVPMATLQAALNAEVPNRLLTIDREEEVCVPPASVKVGERRLRVTPAIRCRIVGHVDRGPIRLTGRGETIRMTMPVSAVVAAKDIGRIIRSETATAAADVRADIRLSLDRNWQPVARISIDYDWTEEPGIDLLGQRIRFANRADPELAKLIADVERRLPARLRTLGLDQQVASLWQKGFTSIDVNHANPEVWIRLTPQRLGVGAIQAEGRNLVLPIMLNAETETFVGPRPPDPTPTPLPPMIPIDGRDRALRFAAPVIADFAELEPIVARELAQLAAEPIEVPVAGPTEVSFGKPTIYTTTGGRLAIGLPLDVKPARQFLAARGTIWLTGQPTNLPNSRKIVVNDLQIAGDVEGMAGQILLRVAQAPAVLAAVERGLSHDFEGDFQKLMAIIEGVLRALPIGDFVASARVTGVNNGVVQPVGQGLFLPVEAFGDATLRLAPAEAHAIREEKRQARLAREAARAAQAAPASPPGPPAGA
jgi:hypothetical protein